MALSDDTKIGKCGRLSVSGCASVVVSDLDPEPRRWLKIGHEACEAADKADPYAIGLVAGGLWLTIAERPKKSCPIELIQALDEAYTHGHAAGLASRPSGWKIVIDHFSTECWITVHPPTGSEAEPFCLGDMRASVEDVKKLPVVRALAEGLHAEVVVEEKP